MRHLLAMIAAILAMTSAGAQTSRQLREAYTHAFQLTDSIDDHDFKLALQFEESVMEWNRATAQLYFELVDDSVSGEQWISRYEPRMTRVRAAVRRGTEILGKVRNPQVKLLLRGIHEGNLTMLIGYEKVAEGIRSGSETTFNHGIERIQTGSARKRIVGLPFVKRLQEKLGREIMEKSFERSIAVVIDELEKTSSR